jgi:TRAP transporter 4TM/12TM fusion protein
MAETIGVPYFEIVKAAFIPAILSYAAIFSIVHLEALKKGISGMAKEDIPPFIKTLLSGAHFLIPIAVLIFMLLILFWTPSTSASWGILAGALVAICNNILKAKRSSQVTVDDKAHKDPSFENYREKPKDFIVRRVKGELLGALELGAQNMMGVAAACACCGIIIGVVTLTGLGLKMAAFITYLAGGKLFLTLLYSVFACIILGMGLPTAATYIIMASMTAPAIHTLSSDMNLGIPIIAIHLFVFYYGIVADDTPPVGLCAYAASGIAETDPIKTGWKSFRLDLAAFTLPFMFIYNPKLIMHNTNWLELLYIVPISVIGMYCWSVFIQGFFIVKTKIWERFLFLIIAFLLVNPSGISIGHIHISELIVNFIAIALLLGLFLCQRFRQNNNKAMEQQYFTINPTQERKKL